MKSQKYAKLFLFLFLFLLTITCVDDRGKKFVTTIGKSVRTINYLISVESVNTKTVIGNPNFVKSYQAPEGFIYIAIVWKYRNMTKQRRSGLMVPQIQLFDPNGNAYSTLRMESSVFSGEKGIRAGTDTYGTDNEEIGPETTYYEARVFMVRKDNWKESGWILYINADNIVEVIIN